MGRPQGELLIDTGVFKHCCNQGRCIKVGASCGAEKQSRSWLGLGMYWSKPRKEGCQNPGRPGPIPLVHIEGYGRQPPVIQIPPFSG